MNAKKLIALVLCAVMLLSLAACTAGESGATTTAPQGSTSGTTAPTDPKPTDPPAPKAPASIDFEDGSMSFTAVYTGKANADASKLEIVDYKGSKALKVTNGSGKVPYVAFDVSSLLGENVSKVASIEVSIGLEHPDGTFYAASGTIVTWTGVDLIERTHAWSVYLENKNPKVSVAALDTAGGEVFTADKNILMITLIDDNGAEKGAKNANMIIDDIRFLDEEGNLIEADTSVAFNGPDAFNAEKDMSNLKYLKDAVLLDGSAIKGGSWGQTDVGSAVDQWLPLMVPGAVIEIEYTSANGDIWLVMPDATKDGAGFWARINADNGVTVMYNNSKNIAQITYEDMVSVLGEDTSTWGGRIQGEASGDWEIFSIKIGMDSGLVHTTNKTLLDGSAITGGSWGQTDVGSAVDQWLPLMVPGAVLEIEYTSANGDMWIVMPDATKDGASFWARINGDNGVTPACNGSVCQITYEQIASVLGEDTSTWGGRIQCEASGDWEVYSVSICKSTLVNTANNVLLDGSAITGGSWGQTDVGSAVDQWLPLMVPGAVITIQYESTNGDIWLVLPDATKDGTGSWTRLDSVVAYDGTLAQITYEDIVSILGEDTSTWGGRLQGEASGDWQIYAIYIGTAVQ